jgi:hypothetical protein
LHLRRQLRNTRHGACWARQVAGGRIGSVGNAGNQAQHQGGHRAIQNEYTGSPCCAAPWFESNDFNREDLTEKILTESQTVKSWRRHFRNLVAQDDVQNVSTPDRGNDITSSAISVSLNCSRKAG